MPCARARVCEYDIHYIGKPRQYSWKNIVPWRIGDLWKSKREHSRNIVIYRRDVGLAMWRPVLGRGCWGRRSDDLFRHVSRGEDRIGRGGKNGRQPDSSLDLALLQNYYTRVQYHSMILWRDAYDVRSRQTGAGALVYSCTVSVARRNLWSAHHVYSKSRIKGEGVWKLQPRVSKKMRASKNITGL